GRRRVGAGTQAAGAEAGVDKDHIPCAAPGFADLKHPDGRAAQVGGGEGEVRHRSPVQPGLDDAAGPVDVEMQLYNVPARTGRQAAWGGHVRGVVVEGKLAPGGL